MTTQTATTGDNDITLRDVVNHMSVMKGELVTKMNDMEKRLTKRMDENTTSIQYLDRKITTVEKNLTERIDALQEDLTATIKDTIKIRKYVGMALPDE